MLPTGLPTQTELRTLHETERLLLVDDSRALRVTSPCSGSPAVRALGLCAVIVSGTLSCSSTPTGPSSGAEFVARHLRTVARGDDAEFLGRWHQIWDEVEAYYFEHVCPPESFDLVILNGDATPSSGANTAPARRSL